MCNDISSILDSSLHNRPQHVQVLLYHNTILMAQNKTYRKTSNISRTLVGNKIVDNSDVVGAPPVGATPTTSSFST